VLAVRDAELERLQAEVAELEAQRERRRVRLVALQNDALNMRGSLSPNGEDRKVPFPLGETLTPAVDWLIARVAELEAERGLVVAILDQRDAGRLSDEQGASGVRSALTPASVGQIAEARAWAAGVSLREPEPEFHAYLHHENRVSHDMPETGGAS
jgi:hypothetical protein